MERLAFCKPRLSQTRRQDQLGDKSLADVDPTWPPVENEASPQKQVEEHQDRSSDQLPAYTIGPRQTALGSIDSNLFRLKFGVSALVLEPAPERLPIIVMDHASQ